MNEKREKPREQPREKPPEGQPKLRRYDEHHALLGRKVSVLEAGSGTLLSGRCGGLDSTGRLILANRQKTHRVLAGQVRVH